MKTTITFSNDEKAVIVDRIKRYFDEELGQEIGGFDAEFLLDFFAREIGPRFYNQALADSQWVLTERLQLLNEALDELEKPLPS